MTARIDDYKDTAMYSKLKKKGKKLARRGAKVLVVA